MMLAHNVFFSLTDRSEAAVAKLVASCKKNLTGHPGVVFFACGTVEPELARPVNDRDFDVALHIVFEDRAAHDLYQDAPRHHAFIAECRDNWARVRVFDTAVETG
jgi:Stress responsive A/B Barrel Domain